jgi:hypothetical protein
MEQALSRAIYYLHGKDDSYLNYNIITEIIYESKDKLEHILKFLDSNIQVRNVFGDQENICYEISRSISKYYDRLLINQLDSILIITRYDQAVKLSKQRDNKEFRYDLNIGIIKIDSVIAELNIGAISEAKGKKWIMYPFYISGILAVWYYIRCSETPFIFSQK